jgi:hypothetical protein
VIRLLIEQQELGSLLFSPTSGAGFSIVRFGLGGATDPLNTGTTDQPVSLTGVRGHHVAVYVTGDSGQLAPQTGPLTAPARSLLTVVVGG